MALEQWKWLPEHVRSSIPIGKSLSYVILILLILELGQWLPALALLIT